MHGQYKIEHDILEIHERTYFLTVLESIFMRSLSRLSILIVSMSALEKKCSLVQPLCDMLLLALAPRAGDRGGNLGLSIYAQVPALARRAQGQCSFPQIRICSSRAFSPRHYCCNNQCSSCRTCWPMPAWLPNYPRHYSPCSGHSCCSQ